MVKHGVYNNEHVVTPLTSLEAMLIEKLFLCSFFARVVSSSKCNVVIDQSLQLLHMISLSLYSVTSTQIHFSNTDS